MSTFQTLGLCIRVHDPIIRGGAYLRTLIDQVSEYTHTNSALGGFDTASITLKGSMNDIEDWIERGIGRDIKVADNDQRIVWEGFVDRIDITVGSLSMSVGPLSDVGNRASAVFSRMNTAVTPPVSTGSEITILSQNTISQGLYGIWEKVLSVGETTITDAEYARDTLLFDRAYPPKSQNLSFSGSEPTITLSLKGYFYWLNAYIYTSVAGTTQSATTQLLAVLAADPNAIISTDYSRIDTNAALIPAYENDESFANEIIKNILALGDASANRWVFCIWENRRAYYNLAPTTLEYQRSLQSSDQDVYLTTGERVFPWNVRPAKWLFVNDFLIGRSTPTDLRTDPRCIFIESVTYTAPYDLTITGGKLERLDQVIAQIATGGYF